MTPTPPSAPGSSALGIDIEIEDDAWSAALPDADHLALIAAEAGARVSDHHGQPWLFNRPDPRQASLVCSAPALHPLILRRTTPIPLAT